MANLLVLNGPNLNLLGIREPGHYGQTALLAIDQKLIDMAEQSGHQLACFQSNSEQEIIEKIHQSFEQIDYIIINPAAFTHTSIAIRDALSGVNIPFVEVHLSNIHAREEFRKQSYFSDIAQGVISGLGAEGYELALQYIINKLKFKLK
ncbi:MAG: type II 3-dehydroquinate dehydratase [Gammaproteobacteria bacterium]|nr:type II 3-dehydroquinate dehydratase [Gammaproteobacteria bacterium]